MSSPSISFISTSTSPIAKKPKRPLTPYNLFYRFKRGVMMKSSRSDKATLMRLVKAVPGLESMSPSELSLLHPKDIYALSRGAVRAAMQDKLLPFDGKRKHRKTHGIGLDFLAMSKIMCDQWKLVDESTKSIFQELAVEGKKLHRQRLAQCSKNEAESPTPAPAPEEDIDHEDSFKKLIDFIDNPIQPENSTSECTNDVDSFATSLVPLFAKAEEDSQFSTKFAPSSPKLVTYEHINIVSPTSSQTKVGVPQDSITFQEREEVVVEEDEFCRFIDAHIHLVDNTSILDHSLFNLGDP